MELRSRRKTSVCVPAGKADTQVSIERYASVEPNAQKCLSLDKTASSFQVCVPGERRAGGGKRCNTQVGEALYQVVMGVLDEVVY